MSRLTKKNKQKRIKQGDKIRRRGVAYPHDDALAMLAAGLDRCDWQLLPQHIKRLYRLRANQAMSVFSENENKDLGASEIE